MVIYELKMPMKFYMWIAIGLASLSGSGCLTEQLAAQSKRPGQDILKFDYTHVSFGDVVKGEKRDTVYHFTNIGDEPVTIDLVSACDCTTYTYPEEPIPPGGKGTLSITFDSSSKEENETLSVDIVLKNTNPATGYPFAYTVTYDYNLKLH